MRIYFESSEDIDVWIWGNHSILDDIKCHTSRWYAQHSIDELCDPFEQEEVEEIEPMIPSYSKAYAQYQAKQ